MILTRKQRERVRDIARSQWSWRTGDLALRCEVGKTYSHTRLFDRRKEQMMPVLKKEMTEAFGTGIFASILISLAMKLAMKWIEEWIKEELYGNRIPSKFSELKK